MKRINTIGLGLFLSLGLFFCDNSKAGKFINADKNEGKKAKKGKEAAADEIKVVRKFELPHMLQEVSGISYLDKDRIACVQDEAGAIFIYNTSDEKIENQISFGASGDYEGLAIVGNLAYIIRSDGQLFEVSYQEKSSPTIKEYATGLTASNNVEGLTFDASNKRLLLAIKGAEGGNANYKGIYAFDLATKKLLKTPVFKIDLTNSVFKNVTGKKLTSAIQPSEIAVHPVTGNIYITEATNPQLLILNPQGAILRRYKLSNADFIQPEGMTFSPTGQLYISNEGGKGNGNIMVVEITDMKN